MAHCEVNYLVQQQNTMTPDRVWAWTAPSGCQHTTWSMTLKLSLLLKENSLLTSQFMINLTEKLKGLSERGLRFVGDKAKTIGQPTPDSHPHLMEEDESKYWECYNAQFNLAQSSLTIGSGPLKIKGKEMSILPPHTEKLWLSTNSNKKMFLSIFGLNLGIYFNCSKKRKIM